MRLRQLSRVSIATCTLGLALMLAFGVFLADQFRRHVDAIDALDTLQFRMSRLGVNVNRLVDRERVPPGFAQIHEDLDTITAALQRIEHDAAGEGVRLAARIRANLERIERAGAGPGAGVVAPPAGLDMALGALRRDEAALTAMESRILHDHHRALEERLILVVAGFGGLAFVFGCLCILGFAMLHRRISGPVEELTLAAQVTRHGLLDYHVPVTTGDDEFADMARAFNAMLTRQREHAAALAASQADVSHALAQRTAVLDAIPAQVALLDSAGTIREVNERWRESARGNGYHDPDGWVGADYLALCGQVGSESADDATRAAAGIRDVLAGDAADFELRYACHAPHEERWYRMMVTPVTVGGEGSAGRGAVVMHLDVTDAEQAERAQASTLAILSAQQEVSPDGILVMGSEDRVISFNRRFAEVWDLPLESLRACNGRAQLLELLRPRMADPEAVLARVDDIYARAPERSFDEVELADGRTLERHSAPMTLADGENIGRVWFFRDVTPQKQAEARLNQLAYEDPLTGLPSRQGFALHFGQRLQEVDVARHGGYLVVLDLQGLNDVNQAYGYEVGDGLIAATGGRIAAGLHAGECVGRLGGDQFGILLVREHQPFTQPEDVARWIDELFADPFELGDHGIRNDVRFGLVAIEPGDTEHEEALRRGHLALHAVREQRDVHWAVYSPAMDAAVLERIRVTEGLRGAIARDELKLHYQPKVRLADGQVIGAEALLRWRHPDKGLQPPDAFIPVAERSRMIVPIGEWALRAACEQVRVWQGANLPSVRVAVNVSIVQLVHSDFAETVGRILAETGVDPDMLSIEITESVFEHRTAVLLEQMQRLHALGVRLALDDFGTGYSSLSYLHAYPFDELKVDKAFVLSATSQAYSRQIVEMVIRVAGSLGCEPVAEGIETSAHRDLLLSLGCAVGQGYYFSRPMVEEHFQRLLARHSQLPLMDADGTQAAR